MACKTVSSSYPGATRWYEYLLNFTEQSSSGEEKSCPAGQEISQIFGNSEVHYFVHKCPPLITIP